MDEERIFFIGENRNFLKCRTLRDREDGLYAVEGWKTPVSVEHVTPYGESQISAQYPKARFFYGADGVRRYAIGTGALKRDDSG